MGEGGGEIRVGGLGLGLGLGLMLGLGLRLALAFGVRADAANCIVDDAVVAAAHARRSMVPDPLGALVDKARRQLGAERADPRERHHDTVAAPLAELGLEVHLQFVGSGRVPRASQIGGWAGLRGDCAWRRLLSCLVRGGCGANGR